MDSLFKQFLVAAAVEYQSRVAEHYGFDLGDFHLPEMTDKTEILFLLADDVIFSAGYGPEDFDQFAS